jgi:hypothetical protein
MGETDLLRELHDAYIWKVNAAVAEDRMDLVSRFVDEYTDEALQLMATLESPGCGQPDCAICAGASSSPALAARRRWFSWRRRGGI